MYFSKYNIFSRIKDSENYFLINILSANADIIDKYEAKNIINGIYLNEEEYIQKGYLINEETEKKLFNKKYLDFMDEREKDEIQIFFVPWYTCNFSCSYCYQESYSKDLEPLTNEVIDAFFNYIDTEFKDKKIYITLFGGEPLLPGGIYKEKLKYFFEKTSERNLEIAIVTNGYSLLDYADLLKSVKIREIQVTLDGTKEIHDARRHLKGGNQTFDQIVEGIDELLWNKININLRVVIDNGNIDNLKDLAQFAISKGWTKNDFFKTQIGRNYELHTCQLNREKLLSRLQLFEQLYHLIIKHPEILEFHKPAFSISEFLFENGELPEPLFDSCPGCKTEWAFDYSGGIFSCTATVGKQDERLGLFYPEISKDESLIEKWQSRDIMAIPGCKECSVQLACGGGCASLAKNLEGGILKKDCRPIKELLELGMSIYFEKTLIKEEE